MKLYSTVGQCRYYEMTYLPLNKLSAVQDKAELDAVLFRTWLLSQIYLRIRKSYKLTWSRD